jgi:hypothetical protein
MNTAQLVIALMVLLAAISGGLQIYAVLAHFPELRSMPRNRFPVRWAFVWRRLHQRGRQINLLILLLSTMLLALMKFGLNWLGPVEDFGSGLIPVGLIVTLLLFQLAIRQIHCYDALFRLSIGYQRQAWKLVNKAERTLIPVHLFVFAATCWLLAGLAI